MTSIAQLAFAYARTRALRGALLNAEDGDRLRGAAGSTAQAAALHALGIDANSAADVHAALVARFAEDAQKLVRAWPVGRGLLLAIVGLLEIENLKLVFCEDREQLARGWLPLGRVAQLELEPLREAVSLRAAVESMARTPYGAIAAQVFRAHEKDAAAAQLALDRWASVRLLAEAHRTGEPGARELALRVVRERDLDAVQRQRIPPEAMVLPAGKHRKPSLGALRVERRRACLRTFSGPPFRLACAVALLLLRIEEIRAASGIAEARFEADLPQPSEALARVLAGSAMGA